MAGPTNDNLKGHRSEDELQGADRRRAGAPAPDSEDPVWLALAAARTGIWEWNLSSDAVTWSSGTTLPHGSTPEKAPKTDSADVELVHPDDRDLLGEDCNRAIREGTDLITEYRVIAPDGVVRWMQSRGHVAYDTAGKAWRILGVNIDISDRKLLEEQLLQAQGQAERLRILKATMRTVHDIVNNALMSLQLFRIEAEPHISSRSLVLFDHIVAETAAKLKAIGDLEDVTETQMATGTGIAYQSSLPTAKP